MRKYLRAIARANMKRAGIQKMNKPRYTTNNGMIVKAPSYFAENWRKWIDA